MSKEPTEKPAPATSSPDKEALSKLILSSSLQMIGVSLTVAGIFRGVQVVGRTSLRADNILSFVAVMFLLAWIFAFLTQRMNRTSTFGRLFEIIADIAFLLALCLIVVSVGLIALEII
jgi:hypothetical protein